jgi:transcriptional regulator with XRE-family HTH domain
MNRLKYWREARGLGQGKLAKLSGVAQSTISYIEMGQVSPSVRTMEKLARALGVSISALLDDDDGTAATHENAG